MKSMKYLLCLLVVCVAACGGKDDEPFTCDTADGTKNGGILAHTESDNENTDGTRSTTNNKDQEKVCQFARTEYIKKKSDGTYKADIFVFKSSTGYTSTEYFVSFSSAEFFTEGKTYDAILKRSGATMPMEGSITIKTLDVANEKISVTFTGKIHDGTFYPNSSKVYSFEKIVVIEKGYFDNIEFKFDSFRSNYE